MKGIYFICSILLTTINLIGCTKKVEEVTDTSKAEVIRKYKIENSRGLIDEISKEFYINGGQHINLPTTLNELGDDYSFKDKGIFIEAEEEGVQFSYGRIKYKGEEYTQMFLCDAGNKTKNRDSMICGLDLNKFLAKDTFPVNSIRLGADRDKVLEIMGEPVRQGESFIEYSNDKYSKNNVVKFYLEDNKVWKISIFNYPYN